LAAFPTTFPVVLNKIVGAKDQLLVLTVHRYREPNERFQQDPEFFELFSFSEF
jgi:hypothetical protein